MNGENQPLVTDEPIESDKIIDSRSRLQEKLLIIFEESMEQMSIFFF